MPLVAVLPAAGASARFGRDKLAADLAGVPVVVRSVRALVERGDVALVALAGGGRFADLLATHGVRAKLAFPPGGACRAETVRNALRDSAVAAHDLVAVHDAARPLVPGELVDRLFAALADERAVAPALPVRETVKEVAGPLPARVVRTLPRARLVALQTPQCARVADLRAALERCPLPLDQVTDDAQALELAGVPVTLVPGDERNLKLTTPLDLALAELMLRP